MKKLLDNKKIVGTWTALQVFLLIIGILVAINDDGHASVALLIMVIVFSLAINIILVVLSLFLKGTKKWFYVGMMVFWLVGSAPIFYDFYEVYSMNAELEEMMEEMDEAAIEDDGAEEEEQDSIPGNSI